MGGDKFTEVSLLGSKLTVFDYNFIGALHVFRTNWSRNQFLTKTNYPHRKSWDVKQTINNLTFQQALII